MNLLVVFLTLLVIFVSLKIIYDNGQREVDLVKSEYDQRYYLVRNLKDKDRAAYLLSMIRSNLVKLIDHLKYNYSNDERVDRLLKRFDPDQISENSAEGFYTSYSLNKGEKIVLCLRQRNSDEQLVDLNTMMFVALHELAHIMSESVGHTPEFWSNMTFLLKIAMSEPVRIYQYEPYHQQPQEYCGIIIQDTPLRKISK
ncbi:MAG: Wss1p-related putative metallopeptidase [candidate division WOR-3 bacterium]